MEELQKGLKELKPHRRNNIMNKPVPELSGSKPLTKEYIHMEGTMVPATYVGEGGLVRHQREGRLLVL